ncbi:MAG TPA: L-threonylcarbamoyladenylate synthase [Saprospiraceae bacterium]|nr:L-threonylcarbamoyladenylate synthase [Saprospiraceae bacterium]
MEDNLWDSEVAEVVATLEKGGIVLYPTDTIWGLGCDAYNEKSIEKIYKIKKRPLSATLIVLVDSIEMLKHYAPRIHPRVETLLSMHRQPLTIVYPDVKILPRILYSEKKTVAIRVVQDLFCQAVIRQFGRPIVSTSANISGQPWPKGFGEISSEVIKAANYVVRHRRDEKMTGKPSVIATYNSKGNFNFLRE